jgi:hypothetical protein
MTTSYSRALSSYFLTGMFGGASSKVTRLISKCEGIEELTELIIEGFLISSNISLTFVISKGL